MSIFTEANAHTEAEGLEESKQLTASRGKERRALYLTHLNGNKAEFYEGAQEYGGILFFNDLLRDLVAERISRKEFDRYQKTLIEFGG